jgi:DNA-binding response OmpR family regulator
VQDDAAGQARDVKVLLVEDEPLLREVVAGILEDAGYDVTATCTGDEAVILLNEDLFSILLTDITIPGQIDGIGLAEHAREIHPGLPVVFVSGRPDGEDRVRILGQPTEFFIKPCDAHSLVSAVSRLTR